MRSSKLMKPVTRLLLSSAFMAAITSGFLLSMDLASACEKGHNHSAKLESETRSSKLKQLSVASAWSPETLPHMKNGAVYLKLSNLTAKPADIISVSSQNFKMAHIHRTSVKDGMTTMQSVDQLTVPSGKTAEFKPGGLHIMLMGAKQIHKAGETIPLTFKLADGTEINFEAKVLKASNMHKTHDHSKMHM